MSNPVGRVIVDECFTLVTEKRFCQNRIVLMVATHPRAHRTRLWNRFWQIFNGDHFDIPLLNKYYNGYLTKIKSLDILKEIRNSLGHRVGLGLVAQATLGTAKSGHGLEAIEWWKKGEIDKIIKYCIDDVKITKDIYEYALKFKKLKFKDGLEIRDIPLNTIDWEKKSDVKMTYSLPF